MKNRRQIMSLCVLLISLCVLVGCQSEIDVLQLTDKVQKKVTTVENYHFEVRREDYDVKTKDVIQKMIAQGASWTDGHGEGVRIDKKNGKYVNKIEMISDGRNAYYRSLDGDWMHSMETQTVAKNMLSLPYTEAAKLAETYLPQMDLMREKWQVIGEVFVTKRERIDEFLKQVNQSMLEVDRLKINIVINEKEQTIHEVHFEGYNGQKQLLGQVSFYYEGLNRQHIRQLPAELQSEKE